MTFGSTKVVRDLSFDVARGETFGFLGSNGSGKTTTIRALLGLYEPSGGVLLVNGAKFRPGQQGLGYLPEERGLYKKEQVLTTMVYFGQLKGMSAAAARAWSLDYLDRVGLADKQRVRLDKLSGGEQQKIQLGVTVMNDPELLILDEPTKGFDPVNRRLLMDIIEEQRRAGATVIMVTHQMDEVERLCDRVLLLKDGVARAYGSVPEVQAQFGAASIVVRFHGELPASDGYRIASVDNGRAELLLNPGTRPEDVLSYLAASGLSISEFTPRRRSMESIFVEVYGKEARL
ncbi:ABC-2 type transport system ATP-binding protein [Propionibacterium cyclohexanicum]|uniref:ABC-2 type transport system ATP-binding protein n=2 Tax=Propionibacterium cyclohexanicum TaxID=64702 RepID=A0A1H9RZ03_9ACTN|nr:ABC-2 type transport system ATP-binding protein [Propionibacterium cyclohexanicum]